MRIVLLHVSAAIDVILIWLSSCQREFAELLGQSRSESSLAKLGLFRLFKVLAKTADSPQTIAGV